MTTQPKRVLLFDDDPTFLKILERQAQSMNVETIVCKTLDDFCLEVEYGSFDVALVDFHLEHLQGDVLARAIKHRPVVLMSMDRTIIRNRASWPKDVVAFVSKFASPRDVLNAALDATTLDIKLGSEA